MQNDKLTLLFYEEGLIKNRDDPVDTERIIRKLAKDHNTNANLAWGLYFELLELKKKYGL